MRGGALLRFGSPGDGQAGRRTDLEGSLPMAQKDEREDMSMAGDFPASARRLAGDPPPELGKEIAKQLKSLYGQHISEPLPDKFTVLLEQLAKAERKE